MQELGLKQRRWGQQEPLARLLKLLQIDQLIDDTYRRADQSLYISKHEGRDTITVEGHAYQRSSI